MWINLQNLLTERGIVAGQEQQDLLKHYAELISRWNRYVSLVSHGDVDKLWERHLSDALSLAPYLSNDPQTVGTLLDIGSGGGLPAIPLKIMLPHWRMVLVERSERKVGFLKSAVGEMGLKDIQVLHGEFPQAVQGLQVDAITARAVEKPEKTLEQIARYLSGQSGACRFLFQGDARHQAALEAVFHVEHIADTFSEAGLRRGNLAVVQHRGLGQSA